MMFNLIFEITFVLIDIFYPIELKELTEKQFRVS